jgi:hypothetical protein
MRGETLRGFPPRVRKLIFLGEKHEHFNFQPFKVIIIHTK